MTTAALEERPIEETTDRPAHLAKCRECDARVTYRPTASGHGFTVVKHSLSDPETTFSASVAGIPMCPDGHGEMEIADDQIPAHDAISQVAGQIADGEAVQRSLPGIVPEFNWQGAYLELESKAVEVDAEHRQWQEDAETAKESKKRWEKSAETFQKMGLEFRRRRREKETGATSDSAAVPDRCRFEQLNPGEPCPICTDPQLLAASTVATGSEAHGVEAHDLIARREIDKCVEQLGAVGIVTTAAVLGAMEIDQLAEVQAWAQEQEDFPDDRETAMADLPAGLSKHHVAGSAEGPEDGTFTQVCSECGDTIHTGEGEELALAPGVKVLLAEPCQGRAKRDGHRYPKKGKKKQARRAEATS